MNTLETAVTEALEEGAGRGGRGGDQRTARVRGRRAGDQLLYPILEQAVKDARVST